MRKVDHVLLSRPDAIGDMVLTLPMAGALKAALPGVRITVLGRNYTRAVVGCCDTVGSTVGSSVGALVGALVGGLVGTAVGTGFLATSA